MLLEVIVSTLADAMVAEAGGATRLETAAGVVDFYGSPLWALEAMPMLF